MILLFLKQTKISSLESKNPCNVYWAGCHRQFYNVEISNALFNYYYDFMLQKRVFILFKFLEFLSSYAVIYDFFKSHLVNHSKKEKHSGLNGETHSFPVSK